MFYERLIIISGTRMSAPQRRRFGIVPPLWGAWFIAVPASPSTVYVWVENWGLSALSSHKGMNGSVIGGVVMLRVVLVREARTCWCARASHIARGWFMRRARKMKRCWICDRRFVNYDCVIFGVCLVLGGCSFVLGVDWMCCWSFVNGLWIGFQLLQIAILIEYGST